MVTVDDVRAIALSLPRSYEAFVQGRMTDEGRAVFEDLKPVENGKPEIAVGKPVKETNQQGGLQVQTKGI